MNESDPPDPDVTDSDAIDSDVAESDAPDSDAVESRPTDSGVADSTVTDPDVADSDVTESDVTESDVTESDAVDADLTDCDAPEPDVTADTTDSDVIDSDVAEPDATDPDAPQTVNFSSLREEIAQPDKDVEFALRRRFEDVRVPIGNFGRLDELAIWFATAQGAAPPHDFQRVRAIVLAGDHGIAAAEVSDEPEDATVRRFEELAAGGGQLGQLADLADATIRVVDIAVDRDDDGEHKIRRGSGRVDREDALEPDEVWAAFAAGRAIADDEVDSGTDLLVVGGIGRGQTTVAAALVASLLRLEPAKVVGREQSVSDAIWMRRVVAVRDIARRGRSVSTEPMELLRTCGSADLAAMTGVLIQAGLRKTPVLLDGVVSAAAALAAQDLVYDSHHWWQAAHVSSDPAHQQALDALSRKPILDLGSSTEDGSGALLVVPALRAAIRVLADRHAALPPPPGAPIDEDST